MTEILKRVERFTLGIEKYGYNSEFRQKIELLAEQQPIDIQGNR